MKIYRLVSFIFMSLFAVTGLLFLLVPDQVLNLFNNYSDSLGLPESPVTGSRFYLILAVGYMYVVTVLAFLMYRHPENGDFPLLLAHAKIASSLLSLALFLFHAHYLIYFVNFVIDGVIGVIVTVLYLKKGRLGQWASY
jgi:divalent metal cation (Fe/Co/Zn/Cd) transporter